MAATFEDLRVLRSAEEIADSVWKRVVGWDDFAKDVVGKQLARAADSIGANIAECFGRYHFGEKLQFIYYSRGSIFETKYWLNRTQQRGLITPAEVQEYLNQLTDLAGQLNAFASSLKSVRNQQSEQPKKLGEMVADYQIDPSGAPDDPLFSEDDTAWLLS